MHSSDLISIIHKQLMVYLKNNYFLEKNRKMCITSETIFSDRHRYTHTVTHCALKYTKFIENIVCSVECIGVSC